MHPEEAVGVTNCSACYGCAPACIRRLHAAAPLRVGWSGGVEPPFLPTMRGVVQEHTSHPEAVTLAV
jgi:peptide methionine sulfoxide reductase MsrA